MRLLETEDCSVSYGPDRVDHRHACGLNRVAERNRWSGRDGCAFHRWGSRWTMGIYDGVEDRVPVPLALAAAFSS